MSDIYFFVNRHVENWIAKSINRWCKDIFVQYCFEISLNLYASAHKKLMYTIRVCLNSFLSWFHIFEQLFEILLDYRKSPGVMHRLDCIFFIDYVAPSAVSRIGAWLHTAPISMKWFILCHLC